MLITSKNSRKTVVDFKEQAARRRLARVADVAERYASTLAGTKVSARVVSEGPAPAWSTESSITFARDKVSVDLFTPEGAMSLKGLTLHEVAHILFTPRVGTPLMDEVVARGLHSAFNALEDQRIETLMVGTYGKPVVAWLTATIASYILREEQVLEQAFALTHGRRYLPLAVRQTVRRAFKHQDKVAEFASIIDEYRVLVMDGSNDERALELIAAYDKLTRDFSSFQEGQGTGCQQRRADNYSPSRNGSQSGASQKVAIVRAKQVEEEQDDLSDSEAQGDEQGERQDESQDESQDEAKSGSEAGAEGGEQDKGQGGSEAGAEGNGNEQGAGESGDEQGDDESGEGDLDDDFDLILDEDEDEDEDEQEQAGSGGSGAGTSGNILEVAREVLEDLIDDALDSVAEQVERDLRALNGESDLDDNGTSIPKLTAKHWNDVTPSEVAVRASRAFGTELELLRADSEPAWERMTRAGKVNVGRYLRGAPLKEAFDRWTADKEDGLDLEVVVLADISGSMQHMMRELNESVWAIKRALDRVQASTTVIVFESRAAVLYSADETAGSRMRHVNARGGTVPNDALQMARDLFASSTRSSKILITVTDGDWSSYSGRNADKDDDIVLDLRSHGVQTAIVHLTNTEDFDRYVGPRAHNHELVVLMQTPAKLFALARALVRNSAARFNR